MKLVIGNYETLKIVNQLERVSYSSNIDLFDDFSLGNRTVRQQRIVGELVVAVEFAGLRGREVADDVTDREEDERQKDEKHRQLTSVDKHGRLVLSIDSGVKEISPSLLNALNTLKITQTPQLIKPSRESSVYKSRRASSEFTPST